MERYNAPYITFRDCLFEHDMTSFLSDHNESQFFQRPNGIPA